MFAGKRESVRELVDAASIAKSKEPLGSYVGHSGLQSADWCLAHFEQGLIGPLDFGPWKGLDCMWQEKSVLL